MTSGDITALLGQLKQGNKQTEDLLIPMVYKELRRIANAHLRREARHHSLQPTALVHEAYLRLAGIQDIDWQGRSHFFAVAATVMRRILVDHARARQSHKRGSGNETMVLNEGMVAGAMVSVEVLAVDEALTRLTELNERQSKIVELRFFAGMTEEEAGEALGISVRTVKRDWRIAKAWLYNELSPKSP